MCGAPAPAAAQGSTGLHAERDVLPRRAAEPAPTAGRKATRTVAAIIVLNLLIQAVEFGIFVSSHVEQAAAIRISLFTGLAYYALAAVWVLGRSAELGLRPRPGFATALVGAGEGFVVGGATAITLFGILRVATGRPVLDPTASLLTAQGSIAALLLGVVLVAIAAPVVEEMVFRGFLAEALRHRGKASAVLLSAVAFSLAHLRLAQFRYYLGMGVILALVYWRRGLVGSVAAHATFNGMLMLMAAVASHGPALDVQAAGFTVAVPPTYRTAAGIYGDDLVATGPTGARVEFTHVDLSRLPPADVMARDLARGRIPFPPELRIDYTSVVVIPLPAGPAVSMNAQVAGRDGRMIALPTPGRLWIAVFRSDGSHHSMVEFDNMVHSWRLPVAASLAGS
jgi:membrane protease YdiL (CAAX protease family)